MIRRYFGLPGCGKTTLAVKLALSEVRRIANGFSKHKYVYTNFPVRHPLVFQISNDDIGKFDLSDSLIIIDEATLFADNRDYKMFNQARKNFFMLHRHYNCDIYLFHQEAGAVDKKIRGITDAVFYIKKCKLRPWRSKAIRLNYCVAIPEAKGLADAEGTELVEDVIMGYRMPHKVIQWLTPSFNRRPFYMYFDTHEAPELPELPSEIYSKSITCEDNV